MNDYNILRPLTEDEKKEITPLGSTSLYDNFLKVLSAKVTEYQKDYKPYDSYSAHIDFEDSVRRKMSELSAAVDKSTVGKFEFGDLDKYGRLDNFEYLGKDEQIQTRLVVGIKQEVCIGGLFKFKCIKRGNNISIFVPNDKLKTFEQWLKNVFLAKDKDDTPKVAVPNLGTNIANN